jgi:transposase
MVRERKPDRWRPWIEQACAPETPADLQTFGKGLRDDEAAVRAALSLEWSNGQVEGQVKTLKRQMYGRAKFDLLRQRFLLAA